MRSLLIPLLASLALAGPAYAEGEARPAAKRVCLSPEETREAIKSHHLREPFAVLKYASQHFRAEALSAKLCRVEDEFLYEIKLLHKDGKLFYAPVNAVSGKLVDAKRPPGKS